MIEDSPEFYSFRGVASVFTFQKKTESDTLKVQLIVAKRSSMEVILHFHSSMFLLLNYGSYLIDFRSMRYERHLLRKSLLSLPKGNIRGETFFDMCERSPSTRRGYPKVHTQGMEDGLHEPRLGPRSKDKLPRHLSSSQKYGRPLLLDNSARHYQHPR